MTSAEFVTELKTLLEQRAGLVGVNVHLTETADVAAPAIVLVRGRVNSEIVWETMGPERREDATVPGRVWTTAATMPAAVDQAMAIMAEIATQVVDAPPPVGLQTRMANLQSVAWLPFQSDKGGWFCDAEFDISYQSDLP
jgi:hypothetical protein